MIRRVDIDADYDWHGVRTLYIGASEVPIVCGVSPYASAAELYAEKKGLRPPRVDNAMLRRGRWGEAAVFQALAEERPAWDVVRAKVHVIDEDNRIACTPDGFVRAPDRDGFGIVQTKVIARSIFADRWLLPEAEGDLYGPVEIPPAYRMQVVTERMLNSDECSWATLAVIINGEFDWHLRVFDIDADPVLEDLIVNDVRAFFQNHLDPGIMPAFEPAIDSKLIKHLFPEDDGSEVDLSSDNRASVAVEELTESQKAAKRLEKQIESLKTELTGKLGDATYGRLADGRRLCWRLQKRRAFPVQATKYRVLRILKAEPWR